MCTPTAFRENPLDLAGLAAFPLDEEALGEALRRLSRWVRSDEALADDHLHATVLYALLRIGQLDYHDGTFWEHVGNRLNQAVPHGRFDLPLEQRYQKRLGVWFREALARFDYHIPEDDGWTYLTPILVHAGVPRCSVRGLVQFVRRQYQAYGEQLDQLDADVIAQLAEEFESAGPHMNVRRLLRSRLDGVEVLWSALARCVLAQQANDSLEEALDALPLALDRDEVRAALRSAPPATAPPLLRPRLFYDEELGMVRLWVPGGPSDWRVEGDPAPRLYWDEHVTGEGVLAEVASPLPAALALRTGRAGLAGRTFQTRAGDFPAFWFRAGNGNLAEGPGVALGLEPGEWVVIGRGRPEVGGDRIRLSRSWPRREGWGAWRVEVPARSAGATTFAWLDGEQRHTLPLARRSAPRLRVLSPEPVAYGDGPGALANVPVFAAAPHVRLAGGGNVILRPRQAHAALQTVSLPAAQPVPLPVAQPGLYQVRDSRGGGRVLLEFALVPGLRVEPPAVAGDVVRMEITACPAAGRPESPGGAVSVHGSHPGRWRVEGPSEPPTLSVLWRWPAAGQAPLTLRWPVSALRWRLVGPTGGGRATPWGRQPIAVRADEVARQGYALEVQAPGDEIRLNGQPRALEEGETTEALLPYSTRPRLTLGYGGQTWTAVLFSARPLLDSLTATSVHAGRRISLTWAPGVESDRCRVVAFDPTRPHAGPVVFSLTADQARQGSWEIDWDDARLPRADHLSLTLAAPSGESEDVAELEVALRRDAQAGQALAALIHRPGTPLASDWPRLAQVVLTSVLSPSPHLDARLLERFAELQARGGLDLTVVRQFVRSLSAWRLGGPAPEVLRQAEGLLEGFVTRRADWLQVLYSLLGRPEEEIADRFVVWLGSGVHPGWLHPSRLLPFDPAELDRFPVPLRYYRDLWLVRVRPDEAAGLMQQARAGDPPANFRDLQAEAARRLTTFHTAHDLPWPTELLGWDQQKPLHLPSPPAPRHTYLGFLDVVYGDDRTPEQVLRELGIEGELQVKARRSKDSPLFSLRHQPGHGWRVFQWDAGRKAFIALYTLPDARTERAQVWSGGTLAPRLGVRDLLARWSTLAPPQADPQVEWPGLDAVLRSLPERGMLYAAGTGASTAPLVRSLWALAWVDRLVVAERQAGVFGGKGLLPGGERDFLSRLGVALRLWPALMFRLLALVEVGLACLPHNRMDAPPPGLGLLMRPGP